MSDEETEKKMKEYENKRMTNYQDWCIWFWKV